MVGHRVLERACSGSEPLPAAAGACVACAMDPPLLLTCSTYLPMASFEVVTVGHTSVAQRGRAHQPDNTNKTAPQQAHSGLTPPTCAAGVRHRETSVHMSHFSK